MPTKGVNPFAKNAKKCAKCGKSPCKCKGGKSKGKSLPPWLKKGK